MGLKLVTAPTAFPVTLEQAKLHLNVEGDDYDTLIEAFIAAATDVAESFQGRALLDQTWDYVLDAWPEPVWSGVRRVYEIRIPKPPLIEVTGVFYLDGAGAEQTVDSALYTVDTANEPGRVVLKSGSWPTLPELANAVRVRFRAGYLDQTVSPSVSNVPKATFAAILIIVGDLYANRESVVIGQAVAKVPWAAEALLRRHRFDLSLA